METGGVAAAETETVVTGDKAGADAPEGLLVSQAEDLLVSPAVALTRLAQGEPQASPGVGLPASRLAWDLSVSVHRGIGRKTNTEGSLPRGRQGRVARLPPASRDATLAACRVPCA